MPRSDGSRSILVTGGAGFIGSHLVEQLVSGGDHVTVVDDLSTGRRANLSGVGADDLTFIEGDVSAVLPQLDASGFDEIHHLAAAVGVRLVVDQPVRTIETNVQETLAVLRFASGARVPTVLASTSEVYGKSERIPFAETDDLVLGPTTEPRWAYACSKAIDEFLGLAWHRDQDLPVVVVRFFNTVGPRQVGTWGMVLPRFVAAAVAGEPLLVYGTGEQTRCFCDVRDVVEVLPRLLSEPRAVGTVLNVGRDESISIADLAHLVVATLESSSSIEFITHEEAYGRPIEDMVHRRPDITRLRGLFDFQPRFSLEQTIIDLAAVIGQDAPRSTAE
ncbi:MAG: GDP-mannose 4,6-dehydratase [Phycisphaerales bacterium]|nr:GDP-mannose 4,6-dehydratase [Phycisphaerales bacterium]